MWFQFKPYVSAAQRKAQAARKIRQLQKKGRAVAPVVIQGKKIATSFWGRAWCDNLEAYSDFENRLPRGRTYVRNGSVIDLQITAGAITAMVSGSSIYEIKIALEALEKAAWQNVQSRCAGKIGSLVDLLQGKLSADVMSVVTCREQGLFPKPKEIRMKCSCPDGAYLCKHLAAVLYGVGARLDCAPELLFKLRGVDHLELIAAAGQRATAPAKALGKRTLAENELADVFGIELEGAGEPTPAPPKSKAKAAKPSRKVVAKRATSNGVRKILKAVLEQPDDKTKTAKKRPKTSGRKVKPASRRALAKG